MRYNVFMDMLKDKQFSATDLNIFFDRSVNIRHKVFDFENALKDKYRIPPLMAPIGDEVEPEIPRFIFNSKLGHSQINVSQINCSLNVIYDGEFTKDYQKCEDYLSDRLKLIYPLIEKVTENRICYAGIVNKIQYLVDSKDEKDLLQIITKRFLCRADYDKMHDLNLRYAMNIDDIFYVNLTISNVRNYTFLSPLVDKPFPLPDKKANSVGIQIILDINDRRAFNEKENYRTNFESINKLFKMSKEIINNKLDNILDTGKINL